MQPPAHCAWSSAYSALDRGKQLLDRIVAMLVKLCRAMRDG
jgi:hypothetical protein